MNAEPFSSRQNNSKVSAKLIILMQRLPTTMAAVFTRKITSLRSANNYSRNRWLSSKCSSISVHSRNQLRTFLPCAKKATCLQNWNEIYLIGNVLVSLIAACNWSHSMNYEWLLFPWKVSLVLEVQLGACWGQWNTFLCLNSMHWVDDNLYYNFP